MLTRSLGDHELKDSGVLWTPFTSCRYFPSNFVLVIASDGVWDYMKPQEVTLERAAKETAKSIMEFAKAAKSRDNISVVAISLKDSSA